MKPRLPQVNHPYNLIAHHLSEIAPQLKHRRMLIALQAQVTYLA